MKPVTEGAGGWGAIGATPSDNYINGWESHIFDSLGPTYEIISCFIQNSDELVKISPPLLRHLMTGRHFSALYFLWPITFQDGHAFPAYIDNSKLLELMVLMEATGIPTRFPHASHLYKIFASKQWTAQTCLYPNLAVPLTTMVAREAIACNANKAAKQAIQALCNLQDIRASWFAETAHPAPFFHNKGVAKIGWSWEAMDVRAWVDEHELAQHLVQLADQPGNYADHVFVQEWVEFDVEMRHFVIEANLSNPFSWKPKKIVYTVIKTVEEGSFRNFDRFDRRVCLKNYFANDEEALADAEHQSETLIGCWLQWLAAQSHELPVVVRFDIMAKRIGPGKAVIHTGELTELGGCFLGWQGGPQAVFGAMLRSCFRNPVVGYAA